VIGMLVARRVYLYGIAFATLWMLVSGLAGLLEVALEALYEAAFGPFWTVGTSDLANRVSFYGALAGIGLVTWTIHWGLAARALGRDPDGEGRSAIRKLYLYGVLLVGGLVLTYNLRQLLVDLLGALFGTVDRSDVVSGDVVSPLSMLAAAGAFWAYHARVVQRDRAAAPEMGAAATIRRWCVYLLAFVGLMLLLFAAAGLIARLIELALPVEARAADSGRWLAVEMSGLIASLLTGLVVWLAAWSWSSRLFARADDPDPERDSALRKVYLYGVVVIAVSWTVWNVGQVLYVVLRSLLIPSEAGALWTAVQRDLGDTVAKVLVFGVAWAYHAHVLKREAAAAPERGRQATIRWIYSYLVALVGAITLSIGAAGTLATILDLIFRPGVTRGEDWWEERLSLFATLIVVGLPVWLIPWARLQREVVAAVARRSLARRIYLFLVLGVAVLTLLGSGAFTLYQLLRVALGERWTGSTTSDLIDAASAAAVAGLMLAYHLRVFQHDAALARSDESDEAAAPAVPAVPTPLPDASTASAAAGDGRVSLLVVRPARREDAGLIRARIEAVLPPGTSVETVDLPASDADTLLAGQP
jgi:hypothetical protein